MTPVASRLHARLYDRRRWFHNEWFFKWHYIGGEGSVEIALFDGSNAYFSGIAFSGSAHDIYWDAIVRGVRREIIEQLRWVDEKIRVYNRDTMLKAIDECAGIIAAFARSIRRAAVKKDSILRGDGINFPPEHDFGLWDGACDKDIWALAESLKSALPGSEGEIGFKARSLAFWSSNQGWLQIIGIVVGIVAMLLGVISILGAG